MYCLTGMIEDQLLTSVLNSRIDDLKYHRNGLPDANGRTGDPDVLKIHRSHLPGTGIIGTTLDEFSRSRFVAEMNGIVGGHRT